MTGLRASATMLIFVVACGGPPSVVGTSDARRGAPRPSPKEEQESAVPVVLAPIERCNDSGDGFDAWLVAFRERAIRDGIPRDLATRALDGVHWDASVIELDRTQRPHKATFETFVERHVTPARIKRGRRMLKENAELLSKIVARYGVAPEVLVALWGLETDYGAYQGRTRSLQALATLAYDCRRSARFGEELASALRILKRGDLAPDDMVGAWAGELGQTQFLPSSYEKYGVDFDEDGRVDLLDSVDDALASTASFLVGHGWRSREGYAAGTANFGVLEEWNRSEVYRKTIVVFATKLVSK